MVGSIFFAKMKRKDELKDTWSNFSPLLRIFEQQGENCLGGLLQPPFGELGLSLFFIVYSFIFHDVFDIFWPPFNLLHLQYWAVPGLRAERYK